MEQRRNGISQRYYHGGDELYALREIPGTWHERCLRPSTAFHPAVGRETAQLLKARSPLDLRLVFEHGANARSST